ncbi:MAG: TldD/PmbA family protein [Chloroflexi bacterium]|nr:TldD/PmbA family protein [Chloroflexota bacterium]
MGTVLGERHLRTLIEGALSACKSATQAEVVLTSEDSSLTRFASNTIHQNVAERNTSIRVRAVLGRRIGVASTNSLEAAAIKQAAESACEIARYAEENPEFESLPAPRPVQPVAGAFSEATAASTPEQRAAAAGTLIRYAESSGLVAAGTVAASCDETAVGNSLGTFAYQASTSAQATLVVMGDSSSGYADRAAIDSSTIDYDEMAVEGCGRAERSREPRDLEPGDYEVVLEPYAVAEALDYLAYVGFGATAFLEGRSFMAEQTGRQVASPEVTLYDDGLDPACFPLPFDFEGAPRQRVELIERGIARDVVWDSYTAHRDGRESTGHALPAPNPSGPFPAHLHLAPGSGSVADLVGHIERGIWISRFHYVNVVQPRETVLTGMTRDGAWWVEGGEVRYPIKNLRFSQSMLAALSGVLHVGGQPKLQRGWFGGSLVPALHLASFSFTGKTEF